MSTIERNLEFMRNKAKNSTVPVSYIERRVIVEMLEDMHSRVKNLESELRQQKAGYPGYD